MKKYNFIYVENEQEKETEIEGNSISDALTKLIENRNGNKPTKIKVYCKGEIKNDSDKKSKRGRKKVE